MAFDRIVALEDLEEGVPAGEETLGDEPLEEEKPEKKPDADDEDLDSDLEA